MMMGGSKFLQCDRTIKGTIERLYFYGLLIRSFNISRRIGGLFLVIFVKKMFFRHFDQLLENISGSVVATNCCVILLLAFYFSDV